MKRFSSATGLENRLMPSFDPIDPAINTLIKMAKEAGQDPKIAIQYLQESLDKIMIKDESGSTSLAKFIRKQPKPIILANCDIKNICLILFMFGYLMLSDPLIKNIVAHLILLAPNHPNTHLLNALCLFDKNEFLGALDAFSNMISADTDDAVVVTKDVYEKINICSRVKEEISNEYSIVQLQCGIDIATKSSWFRPVLSLINTYANQLCNLVYILADLSTNKCFIVDPCWDVIGILDNVKRNKWQVEGIILTHHHFDHVGGIPPSPFDKLYVKVPGVQTILEIYPEIPLYVHEKEIDILVNQNGNASLRENIKPLVDLSIISLGPKLKIQIIHTPGHTQGCICLYINESRLLTGDTLFVSSCGRTDFPESDVTAMCQSLKRICGFPDQTIVLPGHRYGGRQTSIRKERTEGLLRYAENEALLFSILSKSMPA